MRDFRRNNRGGNRRNGYSDRSDGDRKQMFDAECANCGRDCRVPFRPTGDKPIYCSQCFEDLGNGREDRGFINERNSSSRRDNYSNSYSKHSEHSLPVNKTTINPDLSQFKDQLSSISSKLDKILRILEPIQPEVPMLEEVKERKAKRSVKKTSE